MNSVMLVLFSSISESWKHVFFWKENVFGTQVCFRKQINAKTRKHVWGVENLFSKATGNTFLYFVFLCFQNLKIVAISLEMKAVTTLVFIYSFQNFWKKNLHQTGILCNFLSVPMFSCVFMLLRNRRRA